MENIHKVRRILKRNVIQNNVFQGYTKEHSQILDLLGKTIEIGESNSALLIGPRGAGKTTVSLLLVI